MKRFAAALFVALAYANDPPAEEGDKEDDPLADGWESVGNWFSARQEPVEWESIAEGAPCRLGGHYGWFRKVGFSSVFIRETVSDCQMAEGNIALTWAQIENPDEAGMYEGTYCTAVYKEGKQAAQQNDIYAKTLDGAGVDFASWSGVAPTEWCKDEATADCKRQSTDQWTRVLTEPQTNFPYESDGDKQSASCTLWRRSETANNAFPIKNGTPYKVTTGYMLYADKTAQDAGTSAADAAGVAVEMTFEAAATLLAGAAVAVVATVF